MAYVVVIGLCDRVDGGGRRAVGCGRQHNAANLQQLIVCRDSAWRRVSYSDTEMEMREMMMMQAA